MEIIAGSDEFTPHMIGQVVRVSVTEYKDESRSILKPDSEVINVGRLQWYSTGPTRNRYGLEGVDGGLDWTEGARRFRVTVYGQKGTFDV